MQQTRHRRPVRRRQQVHVGLSASRSLHAGSRRDPGSSCIRTGIRLETAFQKGSKTQPGETANPRSLPQTKTHTDIRLTHALRARLGRGIPLAFRPIVCFGRSGRLRKTLVGAYFRTTSGIPGRTPRQCICLMTVSDIGYPPR